MGALEGSEQGAIDDLVGGAKLAEPDRRKIEHLARAWQASPVEVALSTGLVSAEEMARALSAVSGLPILDPVSEPIDARLAQGETLSLLVSERAMPWRTDDGVLVIATVNPYTAERTIKELRGDRKIALKIVTERMLTDGLVEALGAQVVEQAVFGLSDQAPELSARGGLSFFQGVWMATILILLAFVFWRAPGESFAVAGIVSGVFFLGTMLFRLVLMIAGWTMPRRRLDFDLASAADGDLPVYSILVALHDEASLLPQITGALGALDYPASKLDILLLLEESDAKTQSAVRALTLDSRFRILTVPDRLPRTKPKACNFGLAFARGDIVALYDAEDRPDPEQLKRALGAFEAHPKTQCVQGRLGFYNTRENWLTRGIMAYPPQTADASQMAGPRSIPTTVQIQAAGLGEILCRGSLRNSYRLKRGRTLWRPRAEMIGVLDGTLGQIHRSVGKSGGNVVHVLSCNECRPWVDFISLKSSPGRWMG